MTDTTRVPGPTSPLQGNSGKALTVVLVAILIAIIKPWGSEPSATTPPLATAFPSPEAPASSPPSASSRDVFDFGVFKGFEPAPGWEIWPAGREVTFGFAMKVGADGEETAAGIGPSAAPSPAPAGSPPAGSPPVGPSPTAGATPTPTPEPTPVPTLTAAPEPTPDTGPPMWSNTITINPANTLTVVAINTPLGYSIPTVRLTRAEPGRPMVDVPIIRLPSPWPDHFLVVGLDDGTGDNARDAWPPGRYTLDLGIEPGGWSRTIGIVVAAPAGQR